MIAIAGGIILALVLLRALDHVLAWIVDRLPR